VNPESGWFRSKRLRLHYLAWGDPARPLLVMLHGGLEHARVLDDFAAYFQRTHYVICPDLRGHGESDWSAGGAYSVLDCVYDLHCLLHHLGPGPVTLIGHSFGGNIAVRYAGLFPEHIQKLVSIEGLGLGQGRHKADTSAMPALQRLRRAMENQLGSDQRQQRCYPSLAAAVERLMANDPLLPRTIAEHAAQHGMRAGADGGFVWKYDVNVRNDTLADITPDEVRALWSAIPCPVLLIYGAKSWASNPATDGRLSHFRNAEVIVVPNAGHNAHHHQPLPVRTAIESFLSRE
jgi:pimeloyl-ACP methyl ester carboxylesterase